MLAARLTLIRLWRDASSFFVAERLTALRLFSLRVTEDISFDAIGRGISLAYGHKDLLC